MNHLVLKTFPDVELAKRWNAALVEMPFATHYVTPNYFTDPYVSGDRFAVLAENQGGEIVAAITGLHDQQNVIAGLFSRPQLAFRVGADRRKAAEALLAGLDELQGGKSCLTDIYSWSEIPLFSDRSLMREQSNEHTSVVILDLRQGPEAIFTGFSQTRRSEIRKALKQSVVEVKELETDGELAELYQIYVAWNERKGNVSDSIEKMRAAAGQRENRRIFIARSEGKVIAGSFYRFCGGGMVEYAANFSLPEYQSLRPNDLIGWHAIQWACGTDCRYFSMGGSHLFLRRFGGDVWTTYRYKRDQRALSLDGIKENAREIGSAAFRRLPVNVQAGVRRVLAR
jgi:hypothetical protein